MNILGIIAENFALFVVITTILIISIHMIQLLVSVNEYLKIQPLEPATDNWNNYAGFAPKVSIIVPAYNEEQTIDTSVDSLLGVEYTDFEIVVVNDGSKDNTMQTLQTKFDLFEFLLPENNLLKYKEIKKAYKSHLHHNMIVIDKENGGKADALNCGVNYASGEYICVIDADSILDKDALLRATKAFIDYPNKVVAVGGAIRLTNGCSIKNNQILNVAPPKKLLPLFQTIEYLRTFHIARTAMSSAEALTIISGAFGLFSKEIIIQIGGYRHNTVGEDYELCVRIHRYLHDSGNSDASIIYCPDAVCWTQAPETIKVLANQRRRWQRGALETILYHKKMVLNYKYGRPAIFAMLDSIISDVLTPITEFCGYFIIPIFGFLGLLNLPYAIAFVVLIMSLGFAQSTAAIMLEEVRYRRFSRPHYLLILLLAAFFENFGYRQLCGFFRIMGFFDFLTGKNNWGEMKRVSFAAQKEIKTNNI